MDRRRKAATYNVKKATCGTYCWNCDGYDGFITLELFGVGYNGGQTQEDFYGVWDDNQWEYDFTSSGSWSSSNNSIMTVNTGLVTGHAMGTTNIWGFAPYEPLYDPYTCSDQYTSCPEGFEGGAQGTITTVTINSITPATGEQQSNVPVVISGTGFGSSQGRVTTNSSITISSWSDSTINATFSIPEWQYYQSRSI